MTNYDEIKQHIRAIESYVSFYGDILNSYPKGAMGLVADINKDDKYRNARIQYRKYFKKLQDANTFKLKNFKKECANERKLKYKKVNQ